MYQISNAGVYQFTCAGDNGKLVSLETLEEFENFVATVSTKISANELNKSLSIEEGRSAYIWLGGTDETSEGGWSWTSGDIFSPEVPWSNLQPNAFGDRQHYAGLALQDWSAGGEESGLIGEINDLSGSNKLFFVVEWPL